MTTTRQQARAWLAQCTGVTEPCTGAWCLGDPARRVAIVRHRGARLYWVHGLDLAGGHLLVCSGRMVPDGRGLVAEPGPGLDVGPVCAPLTMDLGGWQDLLAALPTWAGVPAEV